MRRILIKLELLFVLSYKVYNRISPLRQLFFNSNRAAGSVARIMYVNALLLTLHGIPQVKPKEFSLRYNRNEEIKHII